MSDCVTVVVGAFVADSLTADGDGIVWTVERLDGWFDSATVVAARYPAQPFGERVVSVRENGRPIALWLVAHSPIAGESLGASCFTAMESIATPFKCVYKPVTFEVIDPVLDLHADVRRVAPIKSTILGDLAAVRFQVLLLAEDPYRYDAGDSPFD